MPYRIFHGCFGLGPRPVSALAVPALQLGPRPEPRARNILVIIYLFA